MGSVIDDHYLFGIVYQGLRPCLLLGAVVIDEIDGDRVTDTM